MSHIINEYCLGSLYISLSRTCCCCNCFPKIFYILHSFLPWCFSLLKSNINDIDRVFFSGINSIQNMRKWHGNILQNKNLVVLKLLHCHIIQIITNSKTYKNIETYTLALNIMHDSRTRFSENFVNFIV